MSRIDLGRAILITLLLSSSAAAQLQVSALKGVVVDAQRQVVVGATIVLQDSTGTSVATRTSAPDGTFQIADIAPGSYVLRVELRSTLLLTRRIVIRGSLPVEVILDVGPSVQEDVVVRGDAGALTAEQPASIAGDALRREQEPMPGHRIQSALVRLPGFMEEDNGLVHVRGVDDGLLYVQDGIPVYERLDRLFGIPPSASAIASLHVLDAYIPPEFGFKSGAVIEVRSQTGLNAAWSGNLDAGLADTATRHVEGAASGPLGGAVGLMVTASHERSDRFLDPVDPDNLHNEGWASAATTQLTWRAGANLITASAQGGRNAYDVPHDLTQEQAGQDQRQRMWQMLGAATWQRIVSDRTVWQLSAYMRHGAAALTASPNDTPVTSTARRTNDRGGLLWSLTHQRGRHTAKTGFEASALSLDEQFSFAVTDADAAADAGLTEAAIAHDPSHPFLFVDRRGPSLWSLFAQDAYRVSNRLMLNLGVRYDRSRLLLAASQVSPRAGVAYEVRRGTVLRASAQRLFQPPQSEYLLLASSEEARTLSPFDSDEIGGGSSVPPERQTALDFSLLQDVTSHGRVNVSVWRRRARDVGDPNVFFGTTVTVPNSVARQHAWGLEARVDVMPYRGWSGALSYSRARVEQFGPFTGGLFLEEQVAAIRDGTRFTPDHDQRHSLGATLAFSDDRQHWRVAGAFRYQTGTPVGLDELNADEVDELRGRRGAEVVDFESGRVRAYALTDIQAEWAFMRRQRFDLSAVAWVNNVTNELYAFNFGNAFSGTHFGSGRRVGVSLRVLFRR